MRTVTISNPEPAKVLVQIPNFAGLGFEPVKDPETNSVNWILCLKGTYFINGQATVTLLKWLELIPIFKERGFSIWQKSVRLL
jgi:hypothetical protein